MKKVPSSIKIAIVGGPGAGKTTIASGVFFELKKCGFNVGKAMEYAYTYVSRYGPPTHWSAQGEIFRGQKRREEDLKHCDFIVCDAATFLTISYMRLLMPHKGDFRGNINSYHMELKRYLRDEKKLFGDIQEVVAGKEYDYVFFLPITAPMKQDGVRWQKDPKEAEDISRSIKGFIDFMGIEHHVVTGSEDEKVKKIVDMVLYTYKVRI